MQSIFHQEVIHRKMRRTGAQERNNFENKATNNSIIRLPMEPNLCPYERNSGLFSTMRIKRDTLDLREVEAAVPCGCFFCDSIDTDIYSALGCRV